MKEYKAQEYFSKYEEEEHYNQIPKNRKRSKKAGRKRSSHKHEYESYIGYSKEEDRYFPITECIVCGRVDKLGFSFTRRTEEGYYSTLNDIDSIQKLHPHLSIKVYEKMPF